eukprot:TRINITY_DN6796_c0_g1_i1.p1 TRINITY_DN6796_c0_g1~~TRINITY_DN6796_c0_g1_i1.p1  ORF type:complete len:254 (+),score=50.87 TRINITY_DN6796_c0_g1_i1:21-782(+)
MKKHQKQGDPPPPLSPSSEYLRVIEDLSKQCRDRIAYERSCDLALGEENPDCVKYFLSSEDCYQSFLCYERYQDALQCINAKSPEQCTKLINRSRMCKERYFETLMTPLMKKHLEKMAVINRECELSFAKSEMCGRIMGELDPVCLEMKNVARSCVLSKFVPGRLWSEWMNCYEAYDLDREEGRIVVCDDELENIRDALDQYAMPIILEGGFTKGDSNSYGGPFHLLEFLTDVMYSGHTDKILKEFDPRYDLD